MKRYFIVMYSTKDKKCSQTTGDLTTFTEDGKYINRKKMEDYILNRYNSIDTIITNIIELSEQEHNEWIRK